jgi:pyridoxamine 5'-phosphate oxidase
VDDDPLVHVARWVDEAAAAGVYEPNAMTVATVDPNGQPSVRAVLLKGVTAGPHGGLVFFTNYESRKGRELAANPKVAAALVWPTLGRQVRVVGTASKVSPEESDAYWATRPRASQVAAWASPQSEVLAGRDELDARVAEAAARFEGQDVPRPPHWGGYRIAPHEIELWAHRDDRLHDRSRWRRAESGAGWAVDRLAP